MPVQLMRLLEWLGEADVAHVVVTSPPAQSLEMPVWTACSCCCSGCPNTKLVAGKSGWVGSGGVRERGKVCCERGAGQEGPVTELEKWSAGGEMSAVQVFT